MTKGTREPRNDKRESVIASPDLSGRGNLGKGDGC
jgi:hypothetical protein